MQMVILFLALGIAAHDALRPIAPSTPDGTPWAIATAVELPLGFLGLLAVVVLPRLLLLFAYRLACGSALRALSGRGNARALRRLDRLGHLYRTGMIANYALDLWAGGLLAVRWALGDLVLIDELLLMLPTLFMAGASWWCYYPIDRRLREAGLIRRLDEGRPVYPIWSRGQFLLAQYRHQVALILLPLGLMMAWVEAVNQLLPRGSGPWLQTPWGPLGAAEAVPVAGLAGAAGVFLISPVLLRHVWDTTPLPPGELRDLLRAMCHRYRVRVRELLLWRTFGGMINAAVMGAVAPLRYILLTDALLDALDRRQVEAVMAHELAHVRNRHVPWMIVSAVATLGLLALAAGHAARAVISQLAAWGESDPRSPADLAVRLVGDGSQAVELAALCLALLGWAVVFGWVSRRYERQADTFAVTHLSRGAEPGRPIRASAPSDTSAPSAAPDASASAPPTIQPAAVEAMCNALQQVADLNHLSVTRRSWRHGSIAWRQSHLRSLVGRSPDHLPIDRTVRRINLASLAGLLLLAALASAGIV